MSTPEALKDDVYCRRLLLPDVLHKGSSISGARAWRILPLGTRVGLASESQAGWSLYWGLSIQQWKETVLKQLNFYSIEEHFFFWYVNTHFLCFLTLTEMLMIGPRKMTDRATP